MSEDPGASPLDADLLVDPEDDDSPMAAASSPYLGADVSFTGLYPSKAHGVELKIEVQPEPQHRWVSPMTNFLFWLVSLITTQRNMF